ncbi:MAG: Omp28-related outer membrane protein [Bacteroidales bacterium]|nr:Omp28-related outer membrane protein [Bacteroidales bacterium]
MKIKKLLYIIPILILAFSACDYIDEPYTEGNGTVNPTDTVKRKILLEDFTGHQCPNCPAAAVVAHQLEALYPGQIQIVTIHAGFFSQMVSPNYLIDFTCTEGVALDTYFGVSTIGNPNGLVNRKEYSGSRVIGPNDWPSKVAEFLAMEPDADINLGCSYNDGSGAIDLTVDVDFFSDFSNDIMICAFLTEDSIIAYQKNNDPAVGTTPEIANYTHMHVLRGSMNGTWGDTLTTGGVSANDSYQKTINYSISTGTWDTEHMHIVVFIYDATTLEVIQSEEIKLK